MQNLVLKRALGLGGWSPAALLYLLMLPLGLLAATESQPMPVVPKWGRFEQSFKSGIVYSNAVQDATLTVLFTSPLGETNLVYGFWDGDKTWRVRFAPNQPGRWTYKTTCSDTANQGLHDRTGELLCTGAAGRTPFHEHGPVQVARDHRHLEHADGRPFFWLADTTWDGARVAEPRDWEFYVLLRVWQRFTVVQWAVGLGEDASGQSAIAGFPDRIAINPEFFQRLDAKLAFASEAGLLSAIMPLVELEPSPPAAVSLSDDQVALLVRYMVARWGAEPVVWLLAFDGGSGAKLAERWKRIGQAVFSEGRHAPVMVYPGRALEALEGFRNQNWVDVVGCQSITDFTDSALERVFAGPFSKEWSSTPPRPIIPFLPCENGVSPRPPKRWSTDEVRQAAYWSLLLSPPAGVSYAAQGVVQWDRSLPAEKVSVRGGNLPLWKRAMYMPGAKQMAHLGNLMGSIEFWRLRPEPKCVATQPGSSAPHRYIAAAGTETKDLALVYVPEERSVELALESLPPGPAVTWLDPRTGDSTPAVAVLSGKACQFPTPQAGDWLLLLRAGKR